MKNEANIISYKVLMDSTGKLVSESSIAEIDKMKGKLNPALIATLKTITRIADAEFKKIHYIIENELDARSYKD